MNAAGMKRKMTRLLKRQYAVSMLLQVLQNRPATTNEQTKVNRGRVGGALIAEFFRLDREMVLLRAKLQMIDNELKASRRQSNGNPFR